jgi:mannose-1-phosphate guanylyltransferase / mannose-6-phosphate isomerase
MSSVIQVQPVIMAGGSGTRLWPLSRSGYPKQFLVLTADNNSLYQQALLRARSLSDHTMKSEPPLTVGNEEHRFLLLDQAREAIGEPGTVLLEPMARNTAPALTLAALQAGATGQDPVMVVAAADHVFTDADAYARAMRLAIAEAAGGAIVVLGIKPTRAETGYGYILGGEPAANGVSPVKQFVEKPNPETARRYVEDGRYCWNSGMFVLRASTWLGAVRRFRPDIAQACEAAFEQRTTDLGFVRPDRELFAATPSESIDYAVMEHCPGSGIPIVMAALDAGWDDLGAWDAVWNVATKDNTGNAAIGDVLLRDTSNSLVHAEHRLVGLVGLQDVIVVETTDAVLVADRSRSQDVKHLVATLAAAGRGEGSLHRKVHRPWGWYDSIDSGPRFQVKRIMVKPGASLSLQMHHHRAEHWIVVNGTAEVTNGDEVLVLTENQSTYIPVGCKHRLVNPGKTALEIIEVQSGGYLGEDDIVRFEDDYGRK